MNIVDWIRLYIALKKIPLKICIEHCCLKSDPVIFSELDSWSILFRNKNSKTSEVQGMHTVTQNQESILGAGMFIPSTHYVAWSCYFNQMPHSLTMSPYSQTERNFISLNAAYNWFFFALQLRLRETLSALTLCTFNFLFSTVKTERNFISLNAVYILFFVLLLRLRENLSALTLRTFVSFFLYSWDWEKLYQP